MPSDKVNLPTVPKVAEKLSRVRQRQKLVEACISALYQHGPSRTTIDKVVAIADMSPGIVNFYFETKAALLVAALEFLAEEFEDRVLAPLGALRQDPVRALRQLIDLYLDPDIASPRKVSVWYAFWGEASARSEYYAICGKRDEAFADLVRDLIERLIRQNGALHLNADAVALALIGALEMIWQEIAFRDEADLDRRASRLRCLAYLESIFPAQFGKTVGDTVRNVRCDRPAIARDAMQIGDAAALLVAAELTLAGVPAVRSVSLSESYELLAQMSGRPPQRLAVRAMHRWGNGDSVEFDAGCDWLAIVMFSETQNEERRVFIVPTPEACEMARRVASGGSTKYRFESNDVADLLSGYESNFALQ